MSGVPIVWRPTTPSFLGGNSGSNPLGDIPEMLPLEPSNDAQLERLATENVSMSPSGSDALGAKL